MRERFVAVRLTVATRKWQARLLVWALFAVIAFTHPYTPGEGRGYLVGMLTLGILCGVLMPRPFIAAGIGLYLATVIRVFTIEPGADPYISIEIIAAPVFVGLARAVVWALVDRSTRYRYVVRGGSK